MRIGIGYDVHKFEKNRDLILGGVLIPYDMGLFGHSDADVLVHSIMDAILGALAMGDIGQNFPDNDDKYKNISSILLLEKVYDIMVKEGFEIGNIDSVIIAEKPKLSPYIDNMRDIIGKALNTSKKNISVKATTEEGLGFTGELKGIGAKAVCILSKISK